jgi:hypothetical protein
MISSAAAYAQSQEQSSGEVNLAHSQPRPDTLQPVQQVDSMMLQTNQAINKVNAADTVIYNTVSKADTLFQAADEGLSIVNQAADFPNTAVSGAADSLTFINKAYRAEQNTIDSLNRILNAPANKISQIESRTEDPTIGRVNNVTSEINEGLGNVGIQHSIDQPGGLGASDQLRSDAQGGFLPATPQIPGLDATVEALDKLNEAGQALDKVQGITEQTKNIGMEVGNISRGDFENTETISSIGAAQLGKTEAFSELNREAAAFGGLPLSVNGELMSADNWQDQAVQMAKEEVIDHFVGRDERLKAAMTQMSKLKGKYKEVKMLDPSQMVKAAVLKGQPWQHRIYPSLLFQVINGQQVIIDFRPGINYRLYGRWTLNGGGIFRTHFSKDVELKLPVYKIGGAFVSVEYKLWRSFSFFQMTQLLDVKRFLPYDDKYIRYTDWDLVFGIKKDFKFTKHLKGTSQAGYNFLFDRPTSPYVSRWHLMFGVYYKFKTKQERDTRKRFGKN